MMTIAYGLVAVSSFFLWWRRSHWGWLIILLVLCLGMTIFVRDVDFSTNLGVQL